MREITITKNLYTFEELPPEIQQKVIERNWDLNVDHDWWEFAYDEIAELWKQYGIGTDDHRKRDSPFYFTLDRGSYFYATGAYVKDYGKLLRAMGICRRSRVGKLIDGNVSFSIRHFGGGNAKTEVTWTDYDGENDWIETMLDGIVEHLCSESLSMLQQEYDYLTSDEAIRESIISNESEFDEEGNPA